MGEDFGVQCKSLGFGGVLAAGEAGGLRGGFGPGGFGAAMRRCGATIGVFRRDAILGVKPPDFGVGNVCNPAPR